MRPERDTTLPLVYHHRQITETARRWATIGKIFSFFFRFRFKFGYFGWIVFDLQFMLDFELY